MTPRIYKQYTKRWISVISIVTTSCGLGYAQDDVLVDEDVYELSPFTIESEEGWIATETLAGSRLRTDFKDIAAQVEVLTMDFMDDYSMTSVNEAAIYSINMENSYDAVTGNGLGGGNDQIRIRGLGTPTNSKEFFASLLRSDNYNLDRITVSSGPSSILFGTGSPAGVINATLKKAFFNDLNHVTTRFDSLGSQRYVADFNKVLIEDKLAVRVIGVFDDERFAETPSYDRDKRYFATLTYKPWEGGTFNASFEDYSREARRPSRVYPFDAGSVALWNEYGRPLLNNDLAWQEAGRPRDGFQDQVNDIVINYGTDAPVTLLNGTGTEGYHSWWGSVAFGGPEDRDSVNSLNQEADGWTFLNDDIIPTDVNTAYFSSFSEDEGQSINLNFQQKIIENMYLDVAYQNEELMSYSKGFLNYIGSVGLHVDPNMYLPDGVTPNPNAGKYYFQGNHDYSRGEQFREDSRAALSYEYDFADKHQDNKWLKWFGKHRMAALVSSGWNEQRQQNFQYRIVPQIENGEAIFPYFANVEFENPYDANGNVASSARFVDNGANRIASRFYVSDGDWVPSGWFDMGEPVTITDQNGQPWTIDPENTGFFNDRGERLVMQGYSPSGKQKQETVQFSYQGYFWEDRVVATYGWRKDMVRSSNLLNAGQRDNWTGLRNHLWDLDWDGWGEAQTGITETIGLVAAPLRGIIDIPVVNDIVLFYNESSTFQPNTNNYSPQGKQYPGALGDGHDIGVRLELFEGRFTLRWSEYENTEGPSRAANTPFNRHRWAIGGITNRVKSIWEDFDLAEVAGTDNEYIYNNKGNGDPYWVVSYKKATGREVSANWRVTDQLDLRFNYTEMDVVESDIGLEWWAWEDNFEAIVGGMSIPEGGQGNPQDLDGDGVIGTWTWDTAWRSNSNSQTLAEWWAAAVNPGGGTGRALIEALDGKSNEFIRSQRANLNWNYRFEDRFDGFYFNGGLRWRPAPLVSYGAKEVAGQMAPDLDNTIMGDAETKLDLGVGYKGTYDFPFIGERDFVVRFNIRNVTEPSAAALLKDVDGNVIRYTRPEPRNFILQFEMDL